jgi:hypothetical protein
VEWGQETIRLASVRWRKRRRRKRDVGRRGGKGMRGESRVLLLLRLLLFVGGRERVLVGGRSGDWHCRSRCSESGKMNGDGVGEQEVVDEERVEQRRDETVAASCCSSSRSRVSRGRCCWER